MGVSYEGAGMIYRYIVCPAGIIVFIGALFGQFEDGMNGGMIIVGLVCAIGGYFGPQFFNKMKN